MNWQHLYILFIFKYCWAKEICILCFCNFNLWPIRDFCRRRSNKSCRGGWRPHGKQQLLLLKALNMPHLRVCTLLNIYPRLYVNNKEHMLEVLRLSVSSNIHTQSSKALLFNLQKRIWLPECVATLTSISTTKLALGTSWQYEPNKRRYFYY